MSAFNPGYRDLYVKEYVNAMQEICEENYSNMQGDKQDPNKLNRGIYYGNEYYHALKETNNTPRLDFLKERHAFYHGWASPKALNRLNNPKSPTGKAINSWVPKENISASVALRALREGPTLVGCGEAMTIAEKMALEKLLGERKFDILFSASSPMPFRIMNQEQSKQTLRISHPIKKIEELRKGDSGYIMSLIELYQAKHMNGEAQAYNVLACGSSEKPRFLAFGINPKGGEGVTDNEIVNNLLHEYNKTPETMELYTSELSHRILATYSSEYLVKSRDLKNHHLTMDLFRSLDGGKVHNVRISLDYSKLTVLMDNSPEDGLKQMKIWTSK